MDYPLTDRDAERGVRFSNRNDTNEVLIEVKSMGTSRDSGTESDHSFPLRTQVDDQEGQRTSRTSASSPLPPPPRSIKRVYSLPTPPTPPTPSTYFPPPHYPTHLNTHPAFKNDKSEAHFKHDKSENPFKHEDDGENPFPLNEIESYKIHDLTFRQTMGVDARRPFFDFDELQRQILGHYQHKLFKADRGNKYGMAEDKFEASRLLMKDYLDALQKYRWTQSLEKMSQSEYSHYTSAAEAASPGWSTCVGDFVDIAADTNTIDPLRRALFRMLPEFITIGQTSKIRRALHREWQAAGLRKPPVVVNSIVDALARFIIAFFGGAFLLAPIILVNFIMSENWRLIIAACFTVGFSFILALVKASNDKILAGSAAYAAVVVMYIGCLRGDT